MRPSPREAGLTAMSVWQWMLDASKFAERVTTPWGATLLVFQRKDRPPIATLWRVTKGLRHEQVMSQWVPGADLADGQGAIQGIVVVRIPEGVTWYDIMGNRRLGRLVPVSNELVYLEALKDMTAAELAGMLQGIAPED